MDELQILKLLTEPGERLPVLYDWMRNKVWSTARFEEMKPEQYLEQGEKLLCRVEELILGAAPGIYNDLETESVQSVTLWEKLNGLTPYAVVIFDGVSLREMPLLEKIALSSGFKILESGFTTAALPSNTVSFISHRIMGKSGISPSLLPSRKELSRQAIKAYYYDSVIHAQEIAADHQRLLLWSSFPDAKYQDFDSRFASLFSSICSLFDSAWKNTVLSIPKGYRIIITSDHGYIFLGQGMESTIFANAASELNQDRFRFFSDNEKLPIDNPGLQIISDRKLAMLRGRIKNRPQGSAGNKTYRHGGMSLMEMLTPWLVLERKI